MAKRKLSKKIHSIMICTPGSQYPVADKRKMARIVFYDGSVNYARLSEDCSDKHALRLIPTLLGSSYNFKTEEITL